MCTHRVAFARRRACEERRVGACRRPNRRGSDGRRTRRGRPLAAVGEVASTLSSCWAAAQSSSSRPRGAFSSTAALAILVAGERTPLARLVIDCASARQRRRRRLRVRPPAARTAARGVEGAGALHVAQRWQQQAVMARRCGRWRTTCCRVCSCLAGGRRRCAPTLTTLPSSSARRSVDRHLLAVASARLWLARSRTRSPALLRPPPAAATAAAAPTVPAAAAARRTRRTRRTRAAPLRRAGRAGGGLRAGWRARGHPQH